MATTRDAHIVIADTSGLISLFSRADRNHAAALAASHRLTKRRGAVIVPADVFTETMNVEGRKAGHAAALRTAAELSSIPFAVIDTGSEILRSALARFARVPESVSFTDCIVMAVADHYATKEIFGFDEGFAKCGYRILAGRELPGAA
jgi:predicted nucleic acid-binding protein